MKSNWKRIAMIAGTVALAATMVFGVTAFAQRGGPAGVTPTTPQVGQRNWQAGGNGSGSGLALTPLTDAEVEALNQVLQDEYHAWAVYDQVIQDFGEISPFVEIRAAESRHAAAVESLFEKYDLTVPENEWTGNVPSFESVEAACAAGAQAEIDNAGLYDAALASTDRRDLTNVFTNLQSASLNQHLPAFQDCSDGTYTPATVNGTGWVDEDGDGVCDNYGTLNQGQPGTFRNFGGRGGYSGRWTR